MTLRGWFYVGMMLAWLGMAIRYESLTEHQQGMLAGMTALAITLIAMNVWGVFVSIKRRQQ